MAIRFTCNHCQQRLSVSESNAGRKAKCPKCKQAIHVPATSETAADQPSATAAGRPPVAVSEPASPERHQQVENQPHFASSGAAAQEQPTAPASLDGPAEWDETSEANEAYSQFTVYDEWIYDTGESVADKQRDTRPADRNHVAVSRAVLYAQGILLGIVALLFFVLGILVGGAGSQSVVRDDTPQPCEIRGSIFVQAGNQRQPDDGAVVLVVPQNARPEPGSKFAAEPLRPGSSQEQQDQEIRREIRELGGDFVRANDAGEFTVRLPDRGRYYVLVLSRRAMRSADEPLKTGDLAQMGRYFLPADQLIGDNRYQWRDESVRSDRTMNVVF